MSDCGHVEVQAKFVEGLQILGMEIEKPFREFLESGEVFVEEHLDGRLSIVHHPLFNTAGSDRCRWNTCHNEECLFFEAKVFRWMLRVEVPFV